MVRLAMDAFEAVDFICTDPQVFADRNKVKEPLNAIAKYMFDSCKDFFIVL